MATNIRRATYRFLPAMDRDSISNSTFEFDESDLYNSARANPPEFCKSVRASRFHRNSSSAGGSVGAPASLPVNVPDWSKILGDEYGQSRRRNRDEDEAQSDEEDGGGRVPPHEFLAKTRIASFSVHEGIGRTLKGRDLSRVRNAIWAKTGFED
ncbi:Senescence regulator S40 [Spatholobus suberectus]|nr:Senescence regulator S40 [Spatholobus suberectus]